MEQGLIKFSVFKLNFIIEIQKESHGAEALWLKKIKRAST